MLDSLTERQLLLTSLCSTLCSLLDDDDEIYADDDDDIYCRREVRYRYIGML